MPGTMTLGDLHNAIQAAMGWRDCHLHAFDIGGELFGDPRSADDVADENRPTLNGLSIEVQRGSPCLQLRLRRRLGTHDCVRKKRAGGRGAILSALYRRKAELSAGRLRRRLGLCRTACRSGRQAWTGEEFDPDEFDLDLAKSMLAARFTR
jgi:hypothetical protein